VSGKKRRTFEKSELNRKKLLGYADGKLGAWDHLTYTLMAGTDRMISHRYSFPVSTQHQILYSLSGAEVPKGANRMAMPSMVDIVLLDRCTYGRFGT
jgi:hypothetical protein